MNDSSPLANKPQSRRWVVWLTLVLFLISIGGLVAWLFVKSFVQGKIQTQLADLNLGQTQIGSISVSTGGVTAHNIQFKLQSEDATPWLTVGRLNINHPISELTSGVTTFNEIELDNAQATLTIDQLLELAALDKASPDFDLSQIELPAKAISVSNSNFQVLDADCSLKVTGVDLNIQQEKETQNITGSIADLVGGQWQIKGKIEPTANRYIANLSTVDLQLNNDQWQSLPYVAENLRNYLTASGVIDISADISGSVENSLVVDGSAKVKTLDINLPSFKLPVTVNTADVEFDLDQITATNIEATIDGQDKLSATATTTLSSFPITTDFETQFEDISIETLRHVVPGIPEILTARVAGNAKGGVVVAADTATEITIGATGRTKSAQYGDLQAESSLTTVVIDSLVFNAKQTYESISGAISVKADAAKQPLQNIFTTFSIAALSKQLDLEGIIAEAKAELDLPLATIEDLTTWQLSVSGTMPEGSLAGQTIANANVIGQLNRGVLELSPLTATAEDTDQESSIDNQLSADVAWPLVRNENSNYGTVVLSGQDLPTHWVVGLIQNQIFNATGEHLVDESSKLYRRISELGGSVNFDTRVNIPADRPEEISRWTATGNVQNSEFVVQQQSLSNLSTNIRLENSKLTLADVSGTFAQGGSLVGNATIDIAETAQHRINVEAQKVPLLWLITVAKNASSEFAAQFNQVAGVTQNQKVTSENTEGAMNIKAQFVTLPAGTPTPWNADLNVKSKELRILGERFKNVNIEANSDSKNIVVKQLKTNFGQRGLIDGNFSWNIRRNTGDGNLDWKSLSIQTLAQAAQIEGIPVTGLTDGKLILTSQDANDPNVAQTGLPVSINGQIAAIDLTAAKIRVKPFKFDVATRAGNVHIENFRTENKAIEFDLTAQAALKPPFQFRSDAALGKLQLSRLLEQSSVTQKEGEVVDVSGIMSGDFHFSGQLSPFDVRTNGKVQIKNPSYHNKPYRDIVVDWDHLGNDWKKSKLLLKAFGGEIKMAELTQKPKRIRVNISGIDAVEVTHLFNLPIELTGKLEGDASLNDWHLTETRWADLELKGSSMLVSEVEVGNFTAKADYRSDKLSYDINGALLGGKFEGHGQTDVGQKRLEKIEFPIEFNLNNALLENLNRKSAQFRSLRELDGNLSATAKFIVGLDHPFEGDGRIAISDAKWSDELLTRLASIHFNLADGRIKFNDVQADLKRGSIKANATIPLNGNLAGKYECEIRQMDLGRIAAIASDQPLEVEGQFDARLNGQIGRSITGQGYIGLDRASLHGVNGQSVRLPVQFTVSTANGSGRAELRRSTFRLFDGSVSGKAKLTFGSRLSFNSDLKLSRIDTGKMIRSLADFNQADQGELNGRLKIKGSSIRSLRDIKGTFEGKLERASAFQLPVLTDMARVLGGTRIQNDDFTSEDIRLQLDNGRVEVKNLNLSSSLANVAITGSVFIDGRLNLGVAGRIERFNQPTLIEELAGSPLTLIRGTPVSLFAQAAEFISDRVVFLKVGGTVNRPQVRVDTRQQLREETIRYFLRGSQILPYDQLRDN